MEQCCVCKASSSDIAFQTPAVSIVGDHVTGTETLSICRSCAQKLYDNAIEAINEPKEEHNGVFAICELVLLVGGVLLAIFVKAVFWKIVGGALAALGLYLLAQLGRKLSDTSWMSNGGNERKTLTDGEIQTLFCLACKSYGCKGPMHVVPREYFDDAYTAERLKKELSISLEAARELRGILDRSK